MSKSSSIANWHKTGVEELGLAFLELKHVREFKQFIRDLCTLEEIEAMSKRWQAVKLVEAGWPYRDIAKQLGLSTTTIARVAHWLRHGRGGYKLVLGRIKKPR